MRCGDGGASKNTTCWKIFIKKTKTNEMSAGKGDKPRSCFSKVYKDNYDDINWGATRKNEKSKSGHSGQRANLRSTRNSN